MMPKLKVINTGGQLIELAGKSGASLMEIMRNGGVDDLQALCGGACACATCHVWVDAAFLHRLPAMSAQESDMLDCTPDRRENSRLSCQLKLTDELDGMRVTVAPV